jgi:hypothetical protein
VPHAGPTETEDGTRDAIEQLGADAGQQRVQRQGDEVHPGVGSPGQQGIGVVGQPVQVEHRVVGEQPVGGVGQHVSQREGQHHQQREHRAEAGGQRKDLHHVLVLAEVGILFDLGSGEEHEHHDRPEGQQEAGGAHLPPHPSQETETEQVERWPLLAPGRRAGRRALA